MDKPFVTKKVAAGHMIQLGGDNHDAQWLTMLEGTQIWTWTRNIFEAAFWPNPKKAKRILGALFG